jgi:predicted glycoside hydrolase/deacetylase ChbG (UPF0249 family)
MFQILINGDDFGYSDGVCKGIVELLDTGALSTTSYMAAAPGAAARAKKWNISRYRERTGVHLQLSGGKPLSVPNDVPSLYDHSTGKFRARTEMVSADPDDVYKEWKRQIEETIDLLGAAPSHLDSHHGFHRHPGFDSIYVSLAQEYGLSARSGTPALDSMMRDAAIGHVDRVIRDWTGRWLGVEGIHETLIQITAEDNPPAAVELASHPAYCDDYLRSVSTLNEARDDDRKALTELAASRWLELHNFKLVTYKNLWQH